MVLATMGLFTTLLARRGDVAERSTVARRALADERTGYAFAMPASGPAAGA